MGRKWGSSTASDGPFSRDALANGSAGIYKSGGRQKPDARAYMYICMYVAWNSQIWGRRCARSSISGLGHNLSLSGGGLCAGSDLCTQTLPCSRRLLDGRRTGPGRESAGEA